jgi:manganese/zinc/iron transport system substrate-binding protein
VIHALSTAVKQGGFVIGAYGGEGSVSGGDDPHFWFDPRNWEVTVTDLADTLSRINPANAATYQNNASEYVEQLRLLQEWALSGMMSVPERQRHLVTSHDAFQYFGAALGWKMKAIQGISTEDEAGVGDIQQIVDFVLTQEIPVLFVESSIPPDTIQAVRRAIEAAGGSVRLGARELFGDAMGEPGTFGGTYVGMIAHNVYTILQSYRLAGLAVEIPAWPEGLVPKPPEIFGGDP